MARRKRRWVRPKIPEHLVGALAELRGIVEGHKREGAICPTCDQTIKIYRRQISGSMACALAWLVLRTEANGGKWIHVTRVAPSEVIAAPERAIMERWGLIEQKPVDEEARTRTSGKWRATAKGADFMRGKLRIKRFVLICNNVTLGFEGELVSFKDCLGKHFDFDELMDGYAEEEAS